MSAMMKARGHLLYVRVYRTLRGRILSGEYEPGARIETEAELTRQLTASIITIRQAEQMLVNEGLLDKQQGRGTFVPESARRHLKILGICGLRLDQGLQQRFGSYYSDLVVLSQQAAVRRGVEFETAWLPTFDTERALRYCDESTIREYMGFLFIACGPSHPLLRRVRELGLRYALISSHGDVDDPRRVSLDYPEAIRLALAQFGARKGISLLVMGIDNLRTEVDAALAESPLRATCVYLNGSDRATSFEVAGYRRMLELIRGGQDTSRIVFLDDAVAQGATRALLKCGIGEQAVKLVVLCGQQEIVPLGYPATFVVHDTQEEVSRAFEILDRKTTKDDAENSSWRSSFRVILNGAD